MHIPIDCGYIMMLIYCHSKVHIFVRLSARKRHNHHRPSNIIIETFRAKQSKVKNVLDVGAKLDKIGEIVILHVIWMAMMDNDNKFITLYE